MASHKSGFTGSVSDDGSVEVIRYDRADTRIRLNPAFPVLDEARLRSIIRDEIRAERKREARTTRAHRDH